MNNEKRKRKKMSNNGSSGCGCFGFIIPVLLFAAYVIAFCFIVWALFFGFTIDGVHHSIGCSTEHGVEVTHGSTP